jgi:hypothetical protein
MIGASSSAFRRSLANASRFDLPFRHWILDSVFEEELMNSFEALAFKPLKLRGDGSRVSLPPAAFLNEATCARYPVLSRVVDIFSDRAAVEDLERQCGITLENTFLRISYHVDAHGFWLRPHTDLAVKCLSLIVLVKHNASDEPIGTEMYDCSGTLVGRAPSRDNSGLMFVPNSNTFHGFTERRLTGTRSTLVVNFVSDAWVNRDELAPSLIRQVPVNET